MWLALLFSGTATGCVHIYQPMSGLHQPVVIDPQAANFQDVRLTVHCIPGELLNYQEANMLCLRVGTLFENQGAQVRTIISARPLRDAPEDGDDVVEAPPTDLILEIRSRLIHDSNDPLLWALCIGTFSVVPAITEYTFAQDIIIRDGSGFLLISDSLQGRIVRRFGVMVWAGNKLLDMTWRKDGDKLTGDAASRDLSSDLYRQLSQLVFNARMQWQVTQEAPSSQRAIPEAP